MKSKNHERRCSPTPQRSNAALHTKTMKFKNHSTHSLGCSLDEPWAHTYRGFHTRAALRCCAIWGAMHHKYRVQWYLGPVSRWISISISMVVSGRDAISQHPSLENNNQCITGLRDRQYLKQWHNILPATSGCLQGISVSRVLAIVSGESS